MDIREWAVVGIAIFIIALVFRIRSSGSRKPGDDMAKFGDIHHNDDSGPKAA